MRSRGCCIILPCGCLVPLALALTSGIVALIFGLL
jgi:hypothetical protein